MTYASSWQDYSFTPGRSWAFPAAGRVLTSIHDHFIPHERNNYHPHILNQRLLGLLSMLMVAVKFAVLASVAFSPAATTYSSAITTSNVLSLTNESRTEYSLPALVLNTKLSQAAQAKAADMAAKGYFAHTSPDGRTPWSFIQAAGYYYMTAGENLAVDFTQAENVETAWMNSPGHRANILNTNYEEIGIGIASGQFEGHNTTFVVQMFGTPAEQQIAFQSQPTAVAPAPAPAPVAPAPTSTVPAPAPAPTPTPVKVAAVAPVSSVPTSVKSSTTLATAPEEPVVVTAEAKEEEPNASTPAPLATVQIIDTSTAISGDQLIVTVTTAGPAVKVMADYNGAAILLDPKSDTNWQGVIPLASLNGEVNVRVLASDMQGHVAQTEAASFAPSVQSNYKFLGAVKGTTINILGAIVDPKVVEQKFYLIMIAGLLACMVLAIAIKRHVQHLSLVANSSFVVVLATLLFMAN
jgi:uncharacterized protein YkwD